MSDHKNACSDKTANSSEDHVIKGIDCHVTGCTYHHPGGKCSATNVKVEAPNAHNKTETYCGSFKALDYSASTGGTASASNSTSFSGGCTPETCGDCNATNTVLSNAAPYGLASISSPNGNFSS